MASEDFIKRHSAFWQQNGFDYQFALFVKYLFESNLEDIVKYEDKDDIVIDHGSWKIDLIQVKHSFLEGKRMTNSNKDIWKTILNWLDFIKLLESEGNPTRDIRCILIVNMFPAHDFLNVIDKVRHGEADYEDIVSCLKQLQNMQTCREAAGKLLAEGKKVMKLISKIEVRQIDNPIGAMFDRFVDKYAFPVLADDVLYSIIGKLWVKKEQHKEGMFQMKVKDFLYEFQSDIQKLTIKPFEPIEDKDDRELPIDYRQMTMVKQLESIGISDSLSITLYMGYYWCYVNSINAYCVTSHEMADSLREEIERKVIKTWQGIYVDANHEILNAAEGNDEKTMKTCGYSCFSQSMKTDVNYNGIQIKPHFSSGWMLALSNELTPRVYWRADWNRENM